jgi:hypothetical protein
MDSVKVYIYFWMERFAIIYNFTYDIYIYVYDFISQNNKDCTNLTWTQTGTNLVYLNTYISYSKIGEIS